MLALLILLPLAMSEAGAAARLDAIRGELGSRPKAQSMAALEQLAVDAAGTAAAGQSLAWLGRLWRGENDEARAERCYRRAYSYRDVAVRIAAARGLGDIALDHRRYRRAGALYREALAAPSDEVMRTELQLKLALSQRGWRRLLCEWAAWLFAALVAGLLIARSGAWRRPAALHWPTELFYAAPVYALLTAACVGRDAHVLLALALGALGSLVLISAAAISAQLAPLSGWRSTLASLSVSLATLGVLFAASNRADILDSLLFTVAP
jgi:hypothetical protein